MRLSRYRRRGSRCRRRSKTTRDFHYNYVFRYHPEDSGVSRDMFAAALDAEGVPADGRLYEPVYRSDLFRVDAEQFPQLSSGPRAARGLRRGPLSRVGARGLRRSRMASPVLLLGTEQDVDDVARAVRKVMEHRGELRGADPALAAVKAMSRAERPRCRKGSQLLTPCSNRS